MADMWMDVDAALSEVPVNLLPLLDDTDFKTRETGVAFNAAGMDLVWNFVTPAGAFSQTAVTPTSGGSYDWTHQGDGIYTIEIPASGGASINNDTEGFGWFTGVATGVLPWRGPVIGFRASGLNDALIESAYSTTRGLAGTALPNAAAEAAGGLYTRGSGAGQINQTANGQVDVNVAALVDDVITAAKLASDVGTEIATAVWASATRTLTSISGLGLALADKLLAYVQLLARKDAAIGTDRSTELGEINADQGSGAGAYANTTDSQEAIRDNMGTPQTGDSFARIGATGSGLTSLASQASVDDLPTNAELATALAAADDAVLAALATVDGNVDAIKAITDRMAGVVMATGTIGATGNSTTALHLAGLTYGDDEINNVLLVILDVSTGEYHARWVEDWADTGDLATVATLPFTPQNSVDTYWLLPLRRDVTVPSAAAIADQVWEEPIGDHSGTAGSTAEQLAAAGAAGDPWATALPGAYSSGQAGKIVGDNLDATVSSRATQTSVDTIDGIVDTITANVSTLLTRITSTLFTGITSLKEWLGLIAGKQVGDSTARTELRSTGAGSGSYDETTDALQALRDRGDAAWTTATGFSTHSAADVWAAGSRTLTSFGTLVADVATAVWAAGTRTLTAFDASFKTGYALSTAGVQAIWDAATSVLTAAGSIGKLLVDNVNATISSRSSHSAADVWAAGSRTLTSFGTLVSDTASAVWGVATRVLTAGTNIVLAKGTGVTGFNDLSAAQVNAEADQALADVGLTSTVTGRIDAAVSTRATPAQVNTEADTALADAGVTVLRMAKLDGLPEGIKTNQGLNNFSFFMADEADHVTAKTGLTVTAERSIDGGAFAACANSVSEIGNGFYKIDLAAADLNGTVIILRFSATGADATGITLKTAA